MKNKFFRLFVLLVVCITTLCSCSFEDILDIAEGGIIALDGENSTEIEVHYLDIGQGDSIFIELPNGESMLIDAGDVDNGSFIDSYIKDRGYDRIDYLVATHPHADHIGSMAYVVNNMDIGQIYMPKIAASTRTYEKLLKAIQDKNLKIKSAQAGMSIIDNYRLSVKILAPVEIDDSSLNNCSIIIKINYGNDSYLFIGDAEEDELDTVSDDMSADVLKVGHHGSHTSTTNRFLKEVNPKYAVISCGAGNDYGHPHKKTINLLNKYGVEYYRTDIYGTVTITSDGLQNYSVTTEK